MHSGIAIPLKYRHNHIEDAALLYTSIYCIVYLLAESIAEAPSFVKLQFEGARCVRSARTDCSPAIGIYPSDPEASFIVELNNSNWPTEAHKSYTYQNSALKPRGKHYVVSNHDVFHEILADTFSESLITEGCAEYEFVKHYFA
ncbi:MAG: hypothetical protein RSE32_13160 [Comamonas sp.]|uniref:hypothetical protein n=1 Tax=Comamonas sp. TaxID=34028 RepID=UPI002FC5D151